MGVREDVESTRILGPPRCKTLLLAACGKLGPGWEGRGEVKEGTCQGWGLNSGLDAHWLCALVSWEMGMRKLVFQNLDVGDKPELRHHLMLYPRILLRLFRTQPFLPRHSLLAMSGLVQ